MLYQSLLEASHTPQIGLGVTETIVKRCSVKFHKISQNFKGKHLCQVLFFNNVPPLAQELPVNFVKFLRTPFFIEHLWWLLLE